MFALLWPRISFTGEYSPDVKTVSVSGFWFRLHLYDKLHRFSLKVFTFDLHPDREREQPPTTDRFDQPDTESHHKDRSIHRKESESNRVVVIKDKRESKKKRRSTQRVSFKHQPVRKSSEYFARYWGYRQLAKTLFARATRLLVRMMRAMRIDYLRSQVTVASSNPALTGMAYGALSPLLILNKIKQVEFDLGADFDQSAAQFELTGAVSCRPLVLLAITATWLTTLPWRRLVRFYFNERRRKKSIDAAA